MRLSAGSVMQDDQSHNKQSKRFSCHGVTEMFQYILLAVVVKMVRPGKSLGSYSVKNMSHDAFHRLQSTALRTKPIL